MIIQIAICDDELEICNMLENILTDILESKNIKFEIEPFYSGESLCKELQQKNYDLLFLDIELKKMSGLDVSRYIREELHNEKLQIAYISANSGYAMELFEFRPINFLIKPLEFKKVSKIIDKFFDISELNDLYFEYQKKNNIYRIPLSDIIYFESNNRKISITTMNMKDEFYGTMEDIYSSVKKHNFLYIHKSYLVNYQHIKKISYREITMFNETILPISQSKRSAIKKAYMDIRKKER